MTYPPPPDAWIAYDGFYAPVAVHRQNGVPVRELRAIWSKKYQRAKRLAKRLGGNRDEYSMAAHDPR
jgi:hypothetical protein